MEEIDESRSSLVLRLFGRFEATRQGSPIEGLHKRQADRLLAYLALNASQWVEKRELAELFWNDPEVSDPDQNFRHSLAYLRQLLEDDRVCLESRTGAVRLVLPGDQVDVLRFEAACACEGDLTPALQMAEKRLLEGWSDAWIDTYRKRYENRLQQALSRSNERGVWPEHTPPSAGFAPHTGYRHAGGIVPLDSTLYIERDSDKALIASMQKSEGIVLVKGPRQTGKSSLLARGVQFACARNWDVYHIDFEQFPSEDLHTRDTLYLRLAALMAEQSEQEFTPANDWKPYLGAVGNLERFLRERVLKRTEAPILWSLDGVDCLFKTDYYNEFFALLRGIHSKRATQPNIPWSRFTLLIAAATEAHLYIRDLNQSPFNVGTRIDLNDFGELQFLEAWRRYEITWAPNARQRLFELLGGHPYLLMRGLQEIRSRNLTIETFGQMALQPDGPYHDHLEYLRRFIAADLELKADLHAVLDGRSCSDSGFFRLRSAGVVQGHSPEAARPRCDLYRNYFTRYLK